MFSEIIALGKRIYNTDNPRELHRFIVFIGRAMLHASAMRELYAWYQQDELRRRVLQDNPFIMEQVTRQFFNSHYDRIRDAGFWQSAISFIF